MQYRVVCVLLILLASVLRNVEIEDQMSLMIFLQEVYNLYLVSFHTVALPPREQKTCILSQCVFIILNKYYIRILIIDF